ncbi:hypothetical protein [Marvinbryantia formatexigens]|nr:hypothetical protein [Marvinbryantia formatexigens]UWO25253.1 hypothetical protein NQ534_01815 [Marvinbryantia formatexigens DSM 14469]SDH04211.1 hypothetical protein SAMN05660368_03735 [Marvinbryantia formatexigens]
MFTEDFKQYIKFPEDIELVVHIFESSSRMCEERIKMTSDERMKKVLQSDKYSSADGCIIIPPLSENRFDILVVNSDLVTYNLWHEMVHVRNVVEYRNRTGQNYDRLYSHILFVNWDEFEARKMSTRYLYEKMFESSGMAYDDFIEERQGVFENLARTLEEYITVDEITKEDNSKYNLMQYLGFVAAIEELCKDKFVLPRFLESHKTAMEFYEQFKAI